MIPRIVGCLSLIVALSQGSAAQADEPLYKSTVWIRAGDRSTGTGFVIDVEKRWVLTAWHVVGDQSPVEVFFRDPEYQDQHRDSYLKNRDSLRKTGRCVAAVVIAKRELADLALIRLESIPTDATAIPIASNAPEAGAICHSLGHRLDPGTLWLRTDGIIRQTGLLQEGYASAGKKIGTGVRVHYAQLPIEVGDSGSAVVNSNGRAIGLVSALAGRAPGTAILISSQEIHKFVAEVRSKALPESKANTELPSVMLATVWIRPESTDGRFAGVIFTTPSGEFIFTSALAVGDEPRVDVIFPRLTDGRLVSEEGEYADRLGLYLSGQLRPAVVLHVDRERDLALLQIGKLPENVKPLRLATITPKPGDQIVAVAHPLGVELRWLLSAGSIRGEGNVVLHPDRPEKANPVGSMLLQLPHQGNCSGGPVVNTGGELLGILASREGPRQESAYCANERELNQFLAAAKRWRSPETVPEILGLARRLKLIDTSLAQAVIETGLRKHPEDYQLQVERLMLFTSIADTTSMMKTMRGKPTTSLELFAHGKLMQRLGEKQQALQAYDAAIKFDGKNVSALVARASLSDRAEAEQLLAKAALIDPNHPEIHRVRAAQLPRSTSDERKLVIDELTRLLEWEPFDSSARRERAELWRSVREFKKAEADELRLTEITPGDAEVWLRLAETRLLQSKQPLAILAMRSALRVNRKAQAKCMKLIVEHAKQLQQDNRNEDQPVFDWLQQSTRGLINELPADEAKQIGKVMDDPKRTMAEKSAMLLEVFSRWAD